MQPETDPASHAPAADTGRNAPTASHWDRLPAEMRRAVLAAAGPLTQWVQGELVDPTGSQVVDMWGDALALEWPLERLHGLPAAAVPAKTLLRETSPAALAAASRLRLHGHADDVAVAAVARGWLDWLPPAAAASPAALALLAAAAGNTPLLEQSLAEAADPREAAAEAAVRAAAMGHVEAVAAARGVLGGDRLPPAVLDTAAAAGELPLVRWLTLDTGDPCTMAAMDDAAANGHLGVVEFLHENRLEGCTVGAMDLAATNGHLDVAVWLHINRTEGCSEAAIDGAVRNGRVGVVEYLWRHYPHRPSNGAMTDAAFNGHTPVLEQIRAIRSELLPEHDICSSAAAGGHIDTIDWVLASIGDHSRADMVVSALQSSNVAAAEHLLGCRIEQSPNNVNNFYAAVHSLNAALIRRFIIGRDLKTRRWILRATIKQALSGCTPHLLRWAFEEYPSETRRVVRWLVAKQEKTTRQWFRAFIRSYAADRGTTTNRLAGPAWVSSVQAGIFQFGYNSFECCLCLMVICCLPCFMYSMSS